MVWIIYNEFKIEKIFDTRKEATDYLVIEKIKEKNYMLGHIYFNHIRKTHEKRYLYEYNNVEDVYIDPDENDFYEDEEIYDNFPDLFKIKNFSERLKKIYNYHNFISEFKEELIEILLNNTEYYEIILNKCLKEKCLEEKPGVLFY